MSFAKTRVCTFNVYNLANRGVPYYESDPYTAEEFSEKTAWIGAQLDRMGADIAGFQEVFHGDALEAALAQSALFQDVEPIVLATNEEEVAARCITCRSSMTLSSTPSRPLIPPRGRGRIMGRWWRGSDGRDE